MRMVVTAGPTREYIDDVRFISNAASGRMGAELARDAARRGFDVTLVMGPSCVGAPRGVRVVNVVSADEMTDAALNALAAGCDILVSAAAIGDFRPARKRMGKLSSKAAVTLRLKPTRKLIREARRRFPKTMIVAYKAVWGGGRKAAVLGARKLLDCADMVVANDVSRDGFGAKETRLYVVKAGSCTDIPRMSKRKAARRVLGLALAESRA